MNKQQKATLLALTALFFNADASAIEGNVQALQNRAAYYGGFGLQVQLTDTCPTGTYSCETQSSPGEQVGGPCCPTSNWCLSGTDFCCPTSQDCSEAVSDAPTCADPSWVLLFNGGGNLICCPPGQDVSTGGECVDPGATGNLSPDPSYTTETQANNASPTGDYTGSGGAAGSSTPAGGGSAPSTTPGSAASGGSTPSPTSAAPTTSATKKSSADKTFVVGGALMFVLALVPLLL